MQYKIESGRGCLVAMGTCALLGACASGVSISDSWVQAYPGARRMPDEVATIVRGGGTSWLSSNFPSQVDGVNYASFRGLQLDGIEVLPGEHVITLECSKGSRVKFATPSAHARLVAGHVYAASCHDYGKSAGADILDLGTGYSGKKAPRPTQSAG